MQGKTVVITGASSGIGFETAKGLAALGARIVMVVRDRGRGEAAIEAIAAAAPTAPRAELVLADLYSLAEVRSAGAAIRQRLDRVDVLVNNAGLIHDKRELTVDGFERTFALNHLAAFLLTYELRDLLVASAPSRIVTVSSMGHRFASVDWPSPEAASRSRSLVTGEPWRSSTIVYGTSKLCNIWFARELARRYKDRRVTSNALHPGAVASNFGATGSLLYKIGTKVASPFLLSTEQGARTSVYLASSPDVENVSGEYFVRCAIARPSKQARDDAGARKLWALSEQLCGITWS